VIHNVGLCIALWDIVKMEDSYIFPMDGSSHTVGKSVSRLLFCWIFSLLSTSSVMTAVCCMF